MSRGADGRLRDADGNVVRAEYALVDGSTDVEGRVVAHAIRVGLTLVRVGGPLVLPVKVTGVYPDTWSGRTVTYRRLDCSRRPAHRATSAATRRCSRATRS